MGATGAVGKGQQVMIKDRLRGGRGMVVKAPLVFLQHGQSKYRRVSILHLYGG